MGKDESSTHLAKIDHSLAKKQKGLADLETMMTEAYKEQENEKKV